MGLVDVRASVFIMLERKCGEECNPDSAIQAGEFRCYTLELSTCHRSKHPAPNHIYPTEFAEEIYDFFYALIDFDLAISWGNTCRG